MENNNNHTDTNNKPDPSNPYLYQPYSAQESSSPPPPTPTSPFTPIAPLHTPISSLHKDPTNPYLYTSYNATESNSNNNNHGHSNILPAPHNSTLSSPINLSTSQPTTPLSPLPLQNTLPTITTQNTPPSHNIPQTAHNIPQMAHNIYPVQQNIPSIQQNIPPVQQNSPPLYKNIPPVHQNIPSIMNHNIPQLQTIPSSQIPPPQILPSSPNPQLQNAQISYQIPQLLINPSMSPQHTAPSSPLSPLHPALSPTHLPHPMPITTTISPTLPSILRTFPTFTPKPPNIPPVAPPAHFAIPIVSQSYLAESHHSHDPTPSPLTTPSAPSAFSSPLPPPPKLGALSSPLLALPGPPSTSPPPASVPPSPLSLLSTSAKAPSPSLTISPASLPSFLTGDWNRDYQELLRMADSPFKFMAITHLANEFAQIAKEYGRIIINEKHLPPEEKTIKPKSFGGLAGGEKFVVQGILFKFALDKCMPTGTWIYGATERNDENAGKAASHELKGAQALHHYARAWAENFPKVDMLFPLVALVDYRGSRLFAVSILPLTSSSLVYGSDDAAATVHKDVPVVNEAMSIICGKMNLQPHCVGPQNTILAGPGDLEVHQVFELSSTPSSKSVENSLSSKSKTSLSSSSTSLSSSTTIYSTPNTYSTPTCSTPTYSTPTTSNNKKDPSNSATSYGMYREKLVYVEYTKPNNNSIYNATYNATNTSNNNNSANNDANNTNNNSSVSNTNISNSNNSSTNTNNSNNSNNNNKSKNSNNNNNSTNTTNIDNNNTTQIDEGYGNLTSYSSDTDDTSSVEDFSSDASVQEKDCSHTTTHSISCSDNVYSYTDMYGTPYSVTSSSDANNEDINTENVNSNVGNTSNNNNNENNPENNTNNNNENNNTTKNDDELSYSYGGSSYSSSYSGGKSYNSSTSSNASFGKTLPNLNDFYGQGAGLPNKEHVAQLGDQKITCYVLDFARVFPPESPVASKGPMQEVFHKLLRPELVYKYTHPLSSDAFSGFNRTPQRKLDNEAVTNATLWLYDTVIPDLVAKWEILFDKWLSRINDDPAELAKLPAFQKWKLPRETHVEGVNMRHLGRILEEVRNPVLAMIVLSEMIARVLKNKMRELLRETTSYQASIKCAAHFLNTALHPKSQTVLQLLQQKYKHGVPENIYGITYSPLYLWQRTLELTGLQVSERVAKPDSSWQVLLESDIIRLEPQIKRMDIVDLAHGTSLYLTALKLMDDQDHIHIDEDISGISDDNLLNCKPTETQPLLEAAQQKLKIAAQSNPRNYRIPLLIGLVETQKWKGASEPGILASACEFLEQSLAIAEAENVDKRLILFALAKQRMYEQKFEEATIFFQASLNPDLVKCLLKDSKAYYYKYKHMIAARNTDSRYLKTISCMVINLNTWVKDSQQIEEDVFWQVKEATLFILAAGCTTVDFRCADATSKMWIHSTQSTAVDAQHVHEYFAGEITKFTGTLLERNPDFIRNFMQNFFCPPIFPALTCAATPGSCLEKNLREFFTVKFERAEREWVEQQFDIPFMEKPRSPLIIILESFTSSNLPTALVLDSLARVAPYLVSTIAYRSGCTLSGESLDVISRTNPTHLTLNRSYQLTNEGFAPLALRMRDSLRVLTVHDVSVLSEVSYTAIGQLRVLQRLVLESVTEIENNHLDLMLQNTAATLVYLGIECSSEHLTDLSPVTRCKKLAILQLKHLSNITNAHLCEVLSKMESVRHLTLEDLSWLGDAGLEALGKLQVVKQLKSLHVNSMAITISGLRGIVKDIEKLEQLSVSQVYQISEEEWGEFFPVVPHLKRFGVSAFHFTNAGLTSFVTNCKNIEQADLHALRPDLTCLFNPDISLKNLTRAQLDNCRGLDDKCLIRLVDIAPNLTYLDVSYCSRLTDTCVVHIATHAHTMHELILDFCTRITDEGVLALAQLGFLRTLGITALKISSASLCALVAELRTLELLYFNREAFSTTANRHLNEKFQNVILFRRA